MLDIGLKDQTLKIPLRFFIEQLLKKNKIVFTGMNFLIMHMHGLYTRLQQSYYFMK